MPKKIYIVDLTKEERTYLLDLIKSGKHPSRKLNRARILLLADEGKTNGEIAEALHTGTATVQRTRQRFVEVLALDIPHTSYRAALGLGIVLLRQRDPAAWNAFADAAARCRLLRPMGKGHVPRGSPTAHPDST